MCGCCKQSYFDRHCQTLAQIFLQLQLRSKGHIGRSFSASIRCFCIFMNTPLWLLLPCIGQLNITLFPQTAHSPQPLTSPHGLFETPLSTNSSGRKLLLDTKLFENSSPKNISIRMRVLILFISGYDHQFFFLCSGTWPRKAYLQ